MPEAPVPPCLAIKPNFNADFGVVDNENLLDIVKDSSVLFTDTVARFSTIQVIPNYKSNSFNYETIIEGDTNLDEGYDKLIKWGDIYINSKNPSISIILNIKDKELGCLYATKTKQITVVNEGTDFYLNRNFNYTISGSNTTGVLHTRLGTMWDKSAIVIENFPLGYSITPMGINLSFSYKSVSEFTKFNYYSYAGIKTCTGLNSDCSTPANNNLIKLEYRKLAIYNNTFNMQYIEYYSNNISQEFTVFGIAF